MKKTIFLSTLVLCMMFFSGCSKQLSQEQLFEKKQECNKYKDDIKKDIEEYNWEDVGVKQTLYLDSIFYSPTLNTCLYYTKGSNISDGQYIDLNMVFDYFTKEVILYTPNFFNEGKTPFGATQCPAEDLEFIQKLQQLK